MYNDEFLDKKLGERKQQNAFRTLRLRGGKIDFCSNDYLGIVENNLLYGSVAGSARWKTGSTGSRLLSGNYGLIEETEEKIAGFHHSEKALLFNSGYDANVGLLSSVPQRGDTIFYDFLSHASIRDGIRLSFAESYSFAHNDAGDLEKKLSHAKGNIFVVTESVFSMDGDICPLEQLAELCSRFDAHLIIDEAHATGIVGERGEGLAGHLQLHDAIFARMHTFGKACGCHGAVVLGSQRLRDFLVNFARSFIYSTALPEHAAAMISRSYEVFPGLVNERKHLHNLIAQFQSSDIPYEKLPSSTPIQILIVPGNNAVKMLSQSLQQKNFDVRPILYPTVPMGGERLRIVLHAFNTQTELQQLIEELNRQRVR